VTWNIEDKYHLKKEKKFADENGLMFLETSAKTAHNVEEAFLKPAQEIYLKVQKGIYDVSNEQYGIKVGISSSQSTTNIVNPAGNQQKKSSCCNIL